MKKRRNPVPKIYLKMFSEIDRHKRERQAAEMSRPMKNMLGGGNVAAYEEHA